FNDLGAFLTMTYIMFSHLKYFLKEMRHLIFSPFFLLLTLIGNGFIILCGFFFYYLEKGINPAVDRYIDALWWSYTTSTTTGYGNITPVTDSGKILSIVLMVTGLALFAMFTALFADIILVSRNRSIMRNRD
ncbi:MAG: ion channel, partial [Bacteriovoracia bacterium]